MSGIVVTLLGFIVLTLIVVLVVNFMLGLLERVRPMDPSVVQGVWLIVVVCLLVLLFFIVTGEVSLAGVGGSEPPLSATPALLREEPSGICIFEEEYDTWRT